MDRCHSRRRLCALPSCSTECRVSRANRGHDTQGGALDSLGLREFEPRRQSAARNVATRPIDFGARTFASLECCRWRANAEDKRPSPVRRLAIVKFQRPSSISRGRACEPALPRQYDVDGRRLGLCLYPQLDRRPDGLWKPIGRPNDPDRQRRAPDAPTFR